MSTSKKHFGLIFSLLCVMLFTTHTAYAEKAGWDTNKKSALKSGCFKIIKATTKFQIENLLGRSMDRVEMRKFNNLNGEFTRQCQCSTTAVANRYPFSDLKNDPNELQGFYNQILYSGGQCRINQAQVEQAFR